MLCGLIRSREEFFQTREWPGPLTLQSPAPDCWLLASSARAIASSPHGISIAIDRHDLGACRMDDWIGHFVEEERQRERTRLLRTAVAAQEAENAALHVRRLMASLAARVSGDVENFARAFPERRLSYEGHPGGGFTARRGHYPEVRLTVEPNEDNGTITLSYVFASQSGVLAPKPSILELSGQAGGWPHFRDDAGQHAFRSTAQLSEVPPRPCVHRPAPVSAEHRL